MDDHPGDTLGTRFLTFWGAVLAFFGFALFAMLLQRCSSGVAEDPRGSVRVDNLAEIRVAGLSELETMGWADESADTLASAVATLKGRKQSETKVVFPGSETANRLAAEAAAAAPAPNTPTPASGKDTPSPGASTPQTVSPEPPTDS